MNQALEAIASLNLKKLRENPYPGRGIVIGVDDQAEYLVQVCWIMGRSENSRNRIFGLDRDTGRVYTEPADPSRVADPTLIIYDAMIEMGGAYAVSNGHQTRAAAQSNFIDFPDFIQAMQAWTYEPDNPIFTPRISGVCQRGRRDAAQMSIVRKAAWGPACEKSFYCFDEIPAGFGYCLTTYASDGNPPPPFRGDPYLLPLHGDIVKIGKGLWDSLNLDNRVSLAVKRINRLSGASRSFIVNKYEKVE